MPDEMKSAEQRQMARKHIFAVNGSAEFLEVLRRLFEEEDYNVTTTNFVPDTFDMIGALKPDIIIIDLVVGQRAGWDLLERLQAEAVSGGIPVVVTSTIPQLLDEVRAEPERYGGQAFLVKPFEVDAMLQAVRNLIGEA